ncbi:hemicentin-1-like isoform X2 [Acropora muricata]|uniref:hemicentin-1-like isoform X2 n=1 Tax=Acropora muricata TaxID=159855 RepID=UPI0034E4C613
MTPTRVAETIVFCCLLLLKQSAGYSAGTEFKITPPSKIYATLGSDVHFRWKLSFGNDQDRKDFDGIVWGHMDERQKIINKYISMSHQGKPHPNTGLPKSLLDRLTVSANLTQTFCNVEFVLKNFTVDDTNPTYGCIAEVYGDFIRDGPIDLGIAVSPKITRRSSTTVDVDEGNNLDLMCEANGKPAPSIAWTKSGTTLQTGSGTNTLQLTNIQRSGGGNYVCTAKNMAGSASFNVLVRIVRYRPFINNTASSPIMVKSLQNHTATLKCAANANPAATFAWYKDDRPISSGFSSEHDASTLTLMPNTTGDFGLYACKVTNSQGTTWHNVTLEQLRYSAGTTFIINPPSKVYATLGSDVHFRWKLSFGNDQDRKDFDGIVWGHMDERKKIINRYISISQQGKPHPNTGLPKSLLDRLTVSANLTQTFCNVEFMLKNFTVDDTNPTYGCIAEVYGDFIRDGPIDLGIAVSPKITRRSSTTVDVDEGNNLDLMCEANGKPAPSIAWTKSGTTLQTGSGTNTLQLTNIQRSGGGNYVCTAKNMAGSASFNVLVQIVRYRPFINNTASSPIMVKSLQNHTATLKCAANANPAATFAWYKDDRPISSGFSSEHDASTLTLMPNTTGDFGLYACKVTNSQGTTWHNVTLEQLRYSAGTTFIINPPSKVYATLGSDVHFRWKLSFGNDQDRKDFDGIVWGHMDERKKIINRYISISQQGKPHPNTGLPKSLLDRLTVSANLTQTFCNVEFVLKNFTVDDTNPTYGCIVEVYGDFIRDDPIDLGIAVSPKITRRSSTTVDVDEGNNLDLMCEANGKPAPSIAWTKSGTTLQTGSGTNTLQLTNIQRSGGGNYVCTAKNMAGSASFNVLVRIVRYRPFINNTASSPIMVKSLQNHTATLKCAANANPAATFAWYKDDRPISSGFSSEHDASTLTLMPNTTGDFGLYACKVTNSQGTTWHNVTLEQLRYSAGTEFKITPPSKIYATLGSDVHFRWKLSFGNDQDRKDFDGIVWGHMDERQKIINKYISMSHQGKPHPNTGLLKSLLDRLTVSANLTQTFCNVEFVLKNFTVDDTNPTYGCIAEVYGDFIRDGPIDLGIAVSPKITRRSSTTVDVDEGNNLDLMCEANGKPAPSIAWTKSGTTLQTGSGTNTLQLTNIQRSGGGNYVCTAKNMAGSSSFNVLVRIVRYRPFINNTASSPIMVKSLQNHTATLKCAANANPAATFAWYKDDRPISSGFSSEHDASTLTLMPNTTGDFGLYACKVTNSQGTTWHNVTLEQLRYSAGTKFIINPPSKVYATLGSDVHFRWKLSFGNDQDRKDFDGIVWGHMDEREKIINRYISISQQGKPHPNTGLPKSLLDRLTVSANLTQTFCNVEFVLKNFIADDTKTTYGCTAEVYGDFVRDGPIDLGIAVSPKITRRSSTTVDVDEGNDLDLMCEANGQPVPSIAWTKCCTTLQTGSGTNKLQLTNIQRSGGGNYVCTAKNMAGSASFNVLVRIVRYRPFINNTASSPIMVKSLQNHAATLKCAANANPAATFAWYKDDRPISSGFSSEHDASTLTLIPNTTGDFGLYACKVTNSQGTTWHNVTLEQLLIYSDLRASRGQDIEAAAGGKDQQIEHQNSCLIKTDF